MIRIPTHDLVGLLTDLALTTADPAEAGATAAIHLHTVRGYAGDEPGVGDLLVGTSTNRIVLGHANVACFGQADGPMLWPIGDVKAVLAVLKPLAKDKDHVVEITRDRDADMEGFVVSEDPDLFGGGLSLSFGGMDPVEFPPEPWTLLREVRISPPQDSNPLAPRTDFPADRLAPFLKIASRRGSMVSPFGYNDDTPSAGAAPSSVVYPLVLDGVS